MSQVIVYTGWVRLMRAFAGASAVGTALPRRVRGGLAACGALMILAVAAGCGSHPAPSPAPGSGQGAGSGSPAAPRATPTSAKLPALAPSQPAGGPVPSRFAATSVTFVSATEAFVLGTAPCATAPCTSIVRTLDRGTSWRGLPAPLVRVGTPSMTSRPVVWGIRFATAAHGFVFGAGLWETTDGGEHWRKDTSPSGSILSLAAIDGQVLALTIHCSAQAGCSQRGTLLRRPLAGGSWQTVTALRVSLLPGPTDMIATQGQEAAILNGRSVVLTRDGGATLTVRGTPCTTVTVGEATSVAVTGPHSLALLCTGQGFTGHTIKHIYVSSDRGARWTQAAQPSSVGDAGTIAAATPARLSIATASAASWLFHSGDAAAHWRTVRTEFDGGMGWADLGFTTTTDGVVVHGPANSDGNTRRSPGQLLFTEDSGVDWHVVRF